MRPWYLDTVCSRHMTNKKNLFIKKFQPNAIKLKYTYRKILTSREISSICLFYIDKNKNTLTTYVDNFLYLTQAYLNPMSLY